MDILVKFVLGWLGTVGTLLALLYLSGAIPPSPKEVNIRVERPSESSSCLLSMRGRDLKWKVPSWIALQVVRDAKARTDSGPTSEQ